MESKITLVCATRSSREEFCEATPLGRCLSTSFHNQPIRLLGYFQNRAGLPAVYNAAIATAGLDSEVLVFLHDDLHILDFFWMEKLAAALNDYDIVGIAGNRRRVPRQPAWLYPNEAFIRDSPEHLSGAIGFGSSFPCRVNRYGPTPAKCELIDGIFLAVRAETLRKHVIGFDERFHFHHYDMDFCREASRKGLTMGTAPIALMHESNATLCGNEAWSASQRLYLEKWGE